LRAQRFAFIWEERSACQLFSPRRPRLRFRLRPTKAGYEVEGHSSAAPGEELGKMRLVAVFFCGQAAEHRGMGYEGPARSKPRPVDFPGVMCKLGGKAGTRRAVEVVGAALRLQTVRGERKLACSAHSAIGGVIVWRTAMGRGRPDSADRTVDGTIPEQARYFRRLSGRRSCRSEVLVQDK